MAACRMENPITEIRPQRGRSRARLLHDQAGLTLIEVLVALVILAIGVYAVLRIFPFGFGTIDLSRQRTVAASLASAELERWKMLADNAYGMPEAIIATDYAGVEFCDYNPTMLTPIEVPPVTAPPAFPSKQVLYEPDGLWLPRTVIGERIIIPAANATGVSLYQLSMAPIDKLRSSAYAGVDEWVQVYNPASLTKVNDAGQLDEENEYFVSNAASGTLSFTPVSGDREFLVTYSWSNAGVVSTMVAEKLVVLSGSTTASLDHFPIIDGSERVYLSYQPTLSNPPALAGQFYVDPSLCGKLVFHSDDTGNEVAINYRVADWTILHEDQVVPNGKRMSLKFSRLKNDKFTNPPRQPDKQFLPNGTDFVMAVDLNDGSVYGDQAASNKLLVNFVTGEVSSADFEIGHNVRVFYRTRDDMAVQVQKAARYYGILAGAGATPDSSHFAWNEAAPRYIYFAPSEAGKVVSLSYYDNSTPSNFITGEIQTISEEVLASPAGIAAPGASGKVYRVTLDKTPRTSPAGIYAFGVSLTTRAVWASEGRTAVPKDRTTSGTRPLYLNETWREARMSTFLAAPLK